MTRNLFLCLLLVICCGCGGVVSLIEGTGRSSGPVDLRIKPVDAEETKISIDSNPLDKVWLEVDKTIYKSFQIQRDCLNEDVFRRSEYEGCVLRISRSGKVLREFDLDYGLRHWLRYGFFDFLGNGQKQLVVHTYSGGAHCCYDYYIFELGPTFQEWYASDRYDSANEIGNELFPVDIDGDGDYEFFQDVMAFDYMGPAGHASASFPPAIFAFNEKTRKFDLANRTYPDFVLKKLKEHTDGIPAWANDGAKIDDETVDEIIVRNTFLYLVYAGKRDQAWVYFEKNYRTKSGEKYQDKFRDQFRREFTERFETDPTYRSIYGGAN